MKTKLKAAAARIWELSLGLKSNLRAQFRLLTVTLPALLVLKGASARAQTTINDTDSSIIYSSVGGAPASWTYGTGDSGDYRGDEHYNDYFQASGNPAIMGPIAVENFSGTAITLLTKKGPNFGIGAWSLDGGPWTTVDAYNPTLLHRQPLVRVTGLSSGAHVLAFQQTGNKNPSSSNIYQVVDAYEIAGSSLSLASASVGNKANGQATFTGSGWTFGSKVPTNLGGVHAWSGMAGDAVSWTFTGSLVEIFGRPDTGDGLFDVYIDGTRVAQNVDGHYGTVDNDALTAYMLWAAKLSLNGPHTIKILVDGKEDGHNGSENSGQRNLVQFDEFAAWTTPPPAPAAVPVR
ncbi:MAG: hypothetical protein ABSE48_17875 [Verrucomicrobiota bacterium]